jgi:HEAT repeat protein
VHLEDLIETSRTRAAAARAIIKPKFELIVADLAQPYEASKEFLQGRFADLTNLGPEVAPLLVERIGAAKDAKGERETVHNCARVLAELGAAPFADDLLAILQKGTPAAVAVSAKTLAALGDKRAIAPARAALKGASENVTVELADALGTLGAAEAVPELADLLRRPEREVRRHALAALGRTGAPEAVAPVLAGLTAEKGPELFRDYLDALVKLAPGHAAAADALLPHAKEEALPEAELLALARALGIIAPKGHKPALDALRDLQKSNKSSLDHAAALAMNELGDPSGTKAVLDELTKFITKGPRLPYGWLKRGEAYFDYGRHADALKDFQKFVALNKELKITWVDPEIHVSIARCEARARNWTGVQKALKESGKTPGELRATVERYPELKEAAEQNDRVKKLLEG